MLDIVKVTTRNRHYTSQTYQSLLEPTCHLKSFSFLSLLILTCTWKIYKHKHLSSSTYFLFTVFHSQGLTSSGLSSSSRSDHSSNTAKNVKTRHLMGSNLGLGTHRKPLSLILRLILSKVLEVLYDSLEPCSLESSGNSSWAPGDLL